MLLRVAVVVCACVMGTISAVSEELGPAQAKAFVVGTIRPGGGKVRFASLPAGTVNIDGASICAHLSGLPFQPCFKVQKIDDRSFRGSIAGLGFAYCDFADIAQMSSRRS